MAINDDLLNLLYKAVTTELGIVIYVSSVPLARSKISTTRKEAMDPTLDCLECRPSPASPHELWIIKKGAKPQEPDT